MALPSSGAISFADINVELGVASNTTRSLNDAATRSLFAKASGAISMFDGRGKSSQFGLSIASDTTNVNLRSLALSLGWDGASKVVATIESGVVVYSTSTGSYAMTINGSFPGGVELVNNGTILGKGGSGGSSDNVGGNGGPALLVQSAVSINNSSGRIAGGGGGGGSGTGWSYCSYQDEGVCYSYGYEPGGVGGGGIGNGSGYQSGTLTSAGSGQSCSSFGNGWCYYKGSGGNGGSYGSAGAYGVCGCPPSYYPSIAGGAGGAALVGNANITWVSTGTRNGAIS